MGSSSLGRPVSVALIEDLADFMGRQVVAVGIHNAHAAAEHRPAAGQEPFADMLLVGERGERAGRLGQAVNLQEAAFESLDRAAQQIGRDRRRAIADELERGKVGGARQAARS